MGGAPSLGTACKIPGGTMRALSGLGTFVAQIRAALGWMTSSESVPPRWDDPRRDCTGRRRTVLWHILPDPFGNGKRQKPLYNDLLGTRTFVGSETKCYACATDVFGPRLKRLHSQPRNIFPGGRGRDAASLSRLELDRIVIARKELYACLVKWDFPSKIQHAMERKGPFLPPLHRPPPYGGERESTWRCFFPMSLRIFGWVNKEGGTQRGHKVRNEKQRRWLPQCYTTAQSSGNSSAILPGLCQSPFHGLFRESNSQRSPFRRSWPYFLPGIKTITKAEIWATVC